MRALIFSCSGLGDGFWALLLANNLRLNGWETLTMHPFLRSLQSWFPNLPITDLAAPVPLAYEPPVELFCFFYEETPWMKAWIDFCQKKFPSKTLVINPIASRTQNVAFWDQLPLNPHLSLVENITLICKNRLALEKTTQSCGLTPPQPIAVDDRHIVLHPFAAIPRRIWPAKKYQVLIQKLLKANFRATIVLSRKEWASLSEEERAQWESSNATISIQESYQDLPILASLLQGATAFIGNDSGVGHLAAALGKPTYTIARNRFFIHFWQPAWSNNNTIITPTAFVCNYKWIRMRDRYWKHLISPKRVFNHVLKKIPSLPSAHRQRHYGQNSLIKQEANKLHEPSCQNRSMEHS